MRLVINDAILRDSKVYTCKASNDAGTAIKHYNIIVKGNDIFYTTISRLIICT